MKKTAQIWIARVSVPAKAMGHIFVYQEWSILREQPAAVVERLECPVQPISLSHGGKLQEARIRQRMTIAELAQELGVPARTVSMYESGSEMPTAETQARIRAILKLSP